LSPARKEKNDVNPGFGDQAAGKRVAKRKQPRAKASAPEKKKWEQMHRRQIVAVERLLRPRGEKAHLVG